jgi:2-polyprenyl-3-methyl-5-hydroxy-6-metoxy-1,4-benzoquinol methylase
MTVPSQNPRPTPERIFQSLNSYQLTGVLKAGIDLGVFTAVGEGADTPAAIASKCSVAERGARILCDYLVVHGFLTKSANRYGLAPDAAVFLDQHSPAYIGACANFVASDFTQNQFRNFADAVRKGGTPLEGEGSLANDHPMWVEFARSMAALQSLIAELLFRVIEADAIAAHKVLDVAAGHGMFGVTLARHNPNAEIYAVDWPSVLEVAKENAQQAGVLSRYHTIAGDAFEVEFGSGYDVVLLPNFLHHYDSAKIERFMRKVHAALNGGGHAITLDFIPNEDRVSPPVPASFAAIMLALTPAGDAYTFAEYEQIFRKAGFAVNELRVLPTTHSVIISRK